MKRYHKAMDGVEAPDGAWVLYEDVEALMKGNAQSLALIHWWSRPQTPQRSQNEQAWEDLRASGGLPEAQQGEGSCACQHDGRGGLVSECQEHQEIREQRDVLVKALGNCYMMAKREIARYLNHDWVNNATSLERWQHVKRFCESAGCTSSILRATLPTEITDGSVIGNGGDDAGRGVGETERK